MRYLLAILLPPLAVFLCGKPIQGIISIILTLCFWIPYNRLSDEYEASEDAANEIRDRIDSVEDVAEDLFAEWETELDQYTCAATANDSCATRSAATSV